MKTYIYLLSLLTPFLFLTPKTETTNDFQGKAIYVSKSTMDLGNWGARLSEAQKKQVMARLKNRLEKTYVLTFNKEESFFEEEEKLDAISGATDSWGSNFSAGDSYKNVKDRQLIQQQEFYGKQFLVKDNLMDIKWVMGTETKQIGKYSCFKAMAMIPEEDLTWFSFSWDKLRNDSETEEGGNTEDNLVQVEAWYSPQIPVSHGPSEYWGLPGLIIEVSAGNTTMLCSKIIMNPESKDKIEAPDKGKEITKNAYQETLIEKMKEFRANRMGRSRG